MVSAYVNEVLSKYPFFVFLPFFVSHFASLFIFINNIIISVYKVSRQYLFFFKLVRKILGKKNMNITIFLIIAFLLLVH